MTAWACSSKLTLFPHRDSSSGRRTSDVGALPLNRLFGRVAGQVTFLPENRVRISVEKDVDSQLCGAGPMSASSFSRAVASTGFVK